jgi:hypothetical protein
MVIPEHVMLNLLTILAISGNPHHDPDDELRFAFSSRGFVAVCAVTSKHVLDQIALVLRLSSLSCLWTCPACHSSACTVNVFVRQTIETLKHLHCKSCKNDEIRTKRRKPFRSFTQRIKSPNSYWLGMQSSDHLLYPSLFKKSSPLFRSLALPSITQTHSEAVVFGLSSFGFS